MSTPGLPRLICAFQAKLTLFLDLHDVFRFMGKLNALLEDLEEQFGFNISLQGGELMRSIAEEFPIPDAQRFSIRR